MSTAEPEVYTEEQAENEEPVFARGCYTREGQAEEELYTGGIITHRSSAARMASQPSPGDRTPRTPPAPSSPYSRDAQSCSYVRKCVVLVDWWLERMDGKICIAGLIGTPQVRKGALSAQGNRRSAARVFKCAIAKRCDSITIETVNGYVVLIKGLLNYSRMRENGFSQKVCQSFMDGFPIQWNNLVDSNMEHIDGCPESPSNSADNALEEHYFKKFMSDSFISSKGYSFAENYLGSFRNLASSDLGETGISNCCKTSVKTDNTLGKNEGRTLRSGRVLGGPLAPMTGANKWKRMQQKASNKKGLANEAPSLTADLTSHENGPSVAGIIAEDKLQSHDSHSKGSEKYARRKKAVSLECRRLFWNLM